MGQTARWLEVLQGYNFTVQHRPGLKHGNVDALSRGPYFDTGCNLCSKRDSMEELLLAANPDPRTAADKEGTSPLVRAVAVNTHNLATFTESSKELKQAQLTDDTLCTVIEWLERSTSRPKLEKAAPGCEHTKPTGHNETVFN